MDTLIKDAGVTNSGLTHHVIVQASWGSVFLSGSLKFNLRWCNFLSMPLPGHRHGRCMSSSLDWPLVSGVQRLHL